MESVEIRVRKKKMGVDLEGRGKATRRKNKTDEERREKNIKLHA